MAEGVAWRVLFLRPPTRRSHAFRAAVLRPVPRPAALRAARCRPVAARRPAPARVLFGRHGERPGLHCGLPDRQHGLHLARWGGDVDVHRPPLTHRHGAVRPLLARTRRARLCAGRGLGPAPTTGPLTDDEREYLALHLEWLAAEVREKPVQESRAKADPSFLAKESAASTRAVSTPASRAAWADATVSSVTPSSRAPALALCREKPSAVAARRACTPMKKTARKRMTARGSSTADWPRSRRR